MSQVIIYSYGVAEFTATVLNAVAAIVNDKSFDMVLKATILLAGLMASIQYSTSRNWGILAASLIRYSLVTAILLIPKYTVTVHDSVMQENFPVGNVPLGLALPSSIVTTTFHYLTTMIESAFHWTNDEQYNKTGFLFASKILKNSYNMQIMDADFKKSLDSYIGQCVFYDIYLGSYTIKDLLNSDNIWQLITAKPSVNRAFLLDGVVTICATGAPLLTKKWEETMDNTAEKYIKIILPTYQFKSKLNQDINLKAMLFDGVGLGYGALTGIARNGADILKQNLMINSLQSAALNNPELGMRSYAITKANLQKANGNIDMGYMMASWLPAMMGVIESMIYSLFPLIIIFCLFNGGERVITNYIMSMVWVGTWPLIFAVLDFGFTWYTQSKAQGYGISYYDMHYLNNLQYQMSSLFGYFTMAVPFLAKGLLTLSKQGLDATFTHMAQLIGGSTQSLAMAASGETVAGNLSLGNTSFDTHSMHNMNGYKYDTNANFASGASSVQLATGSMLTQTANGTSVIKMGGALSDLNTNIALAERISGAISLQDSKVLSAARSEQVSHTENMSSALRSFYDIGTNLSRDTNSSENLGISASSAHTEAAINFASYIDRYAKSTGKTVDESIRDNVGRFASATGSIGVDSKKSFLGSIAGFTTGASFNGKISGGFKAEHDKATNDVTSNSSQIGHEFQSNNNYNNTYESAVRALSENSFRASNTQGQRLLDSMSSSFDKAQQASKSYSAHMAESRSYNELSSYVKDNAATINYNLSQELGEYIASKPLYPGKGAMGPTQAESLLLKDSELRNSYIEDFVQEKTSASIGKWQEEHIDKNAVYTAHNKNLENINKINNGIEKHFVNNTHELKTSQLGEMLETTKVNEGYAEETKKVMRNFNATSNEIVRDGYIKGLDVTNKVSDKVVEKEGV